MQAAIHAASRRSYLSLLGVLPVALLVGFSLPACSSDVPTSSPTVSTTPTDPLCRPTTCSTLGKNCGIVADGCGGSLRCGTCSGNGNDCRDNVCQRGCTSNTECPSGGSCINGSCSDKCAESRDCPSGQNCSNGSCTANAAQYCNYDSECRSDERCTNNSCLGNTSGNRVCRYDSECRGGESCRNGACSSVGGQTCRYHADCRTNETCTNGYCSTQGGSSCSNDSNCSYGERCSYGVCRRTDSGYGRVRSECFTRGISLPLPFGDISFAVENWYYDSQNPNGERVDSCICRSNGTMHIEDGSHSFDVRCSRCIKNGDERTCYE
jgi:hypothetical protein